MAKIIDETNDKYKMVEIDDDMAELAAAGEGGKTVVERNCPTCGRVNSFRIGSGGRAFCTACGTQILV